MKPSCYDDHRQLKWAIIALALLSAIAPSLAQAQPLLEEIVDWRFFQHDDSCYGIREYRDISSGQIYTTIYFGESAYHTELSTLTLILTFVALPVAVCISIGALIYYLRRSASKPASGGRESLAK